ncbi:hypothetical protein FHS32_003520 [Streptomyces albaduncus]|uniref:Uncharacterized protein n=1 Tax=Streptomyces griseoloalbus TaxID=67303 RepID=A0A7W8BSE4_9ACTN|nr:hypothetical protein [Streptomyces albaduncus]GGW59926.1 hypothetical protein GCM10010340_42870 [Streptomyces albaduncus]
MDERTRPFGWTRTADPIIDGGLLPVDALADGWGVMPRPAGPGKTVGQVRRCPDRHGAGRNTTVTVRGDGSVRSRPGVPGRLLEPWHAAESAR